LWIKKYFEDYEIGKEFISESRTIGESDIIDFARLSGDFHPTHFDDDFAKASFYGEKVGHGLLSLSVAMGLINHWEYRSRSIMAFIKVTCRFLRPVKVNDRIHGKASILTKKEWKRPDKGVVVFGLEIINQRGEVVAKAEIDELVWKRGRNGGRAMGGKSEDRSQLERKGGLIS
jgi:acyl dehydratase